MPKQYLPTKLLFFFLLVGVNITSLSAQNIEYLNSNNVNAGIGIGGNLFTKVDSIHYNGSGLAQGVTWDLFETPPGTGKKEVLTAALWLAGYDNNGVYRCAGNQYFEYGVDYYDGPIAASYNANYDSYYKRVFKVTQTQISHFRNLAFPVSATQVDSAILYWPAIGNATVLSDYGVAIDSPLAPFTDFNHNGIYEPLLGEYPAIPGDQGIFFVYNDIRGPHNESGGTPIGVEIRGLASCFTDSTNNTPYYKNAINNSIFVQYQIENKSQQVFPLFHIGMYVDPDLGCFSNDYVGCDSARGIMFAYNAVPYDPDCAPELGYDSVPVALGVQVLSLPLDVFLYFTKGCPSAAGSDPVTVGLCTPYQDYSQGLWADSSNIEYGKSGYNTGGYPTNYCFPGDPTDTSQWSEITAYSFRCDRRMLGVSNATDFTPGQTLHYDLGWTSARDSTANHLSIVNSLKNDADTIRSFYLHHVLHSEQVLGINQISANTAFTVSIYPNPTHNQVTITADDNIQSIELMDIEGRVLLKKTMEARYITLPVSYLAKGVYLVSVQGEANSVIKRIVIE